MPSYHKNSYCGMFKKWKENEGLPKLGKLIFRVGVPKQLKNGVLMKIISVAGWGGRVEWKSKDFEKMLIGNETKSLQKSWHTN